MPVSEHRLFLNNMLFSYYTIDNLSTTTTKISSEIGANRGKIKKEIFQHTDGFEADPEDFFNVNWKSKK